MTLLEFNSFVQDQGALSKLLQTHIPRKQFRKPQTPENLLLWSGHVLCCYSFFSSLIFPETLYFHFECDGSSGTTFFLFPDQIQKAVGGFINQITMLSEQPNLEITRAIWFHPNSCSNIISNFSCASFVHIPIMILFGTRHFPLTCTTNQLLSLCITY